LRFSEFLRATVLLCAGCATLLAALTVIGISREGGEDTISYVSLGWWTLAVVLGTWLGRRAEATPPIARLLATARSQTTLPELRPGMTLVNRLWLLLLSTVGAAAASLFEPQVAAVAAGFCIIPALAWRRQEQAVLAIEQRDGARFYVDRTPLFASIRLIRTPGFGGSFLPS
jgi:hypothetical protein